MSNYTKTEHNVFLQRVKENPQMYDYGGKHYPNAKVFYPDGSVGVGGNLPREKCSSDFLCPDCGSNQICQNNLATVMVGLNVKIVDGLGETRMKIV